MRKAFLQLHTAVFLAGFTGILGKLITLNEGLLVWWRLLISSAALWIIYLLQKSIQRLSSTEIWPIVGAGGIAALHWVTFYGSINYANVSVALVCFSAVGFFTAILEPLILRKPMQLIELALGILTIAGIAIIFHFDAQYKIGIIVGIVSALLGSLFPILNRIFLQKHSAETVTLYQLSGGFLFLCVLMPAYLWIFPADHLIPTLPDLGWLLILSLGCTVLAFTLFMRALKRISAFTVNLSYNLEPIYGIILAFVIFRENEHLSSQFFLGLALILLSVMLQTWFVYRNNKTGKMSKTLPDLADHH